MAEIHKHTSKITIFYYVTSLSMTEILRGFTGTNCPLIEDRKTKPLLSSYQKNTPSLLRRWQS